MDYDETYCYYSNLPSPLAYDKEEKKENILTEEFSLIEIDRIIEMAWEDRTPFDAIKFQFGINEAEVKILMRKQLKFSSYKLWRTRVENGKTKHTKKRIKGIERFKCSLQRVITLNKTSKRRR